MASDFQQRLLQDRYAEYDRENMDRYAEKRHLDPHCPIIHIAGTNGKSSTAHYLESIYRAAGYKVGLFLSPWVFSLKESIRYDGEFITEEKIGEIYEENRKDFDKFHLSSFEISVAIAYRYFEEKQPQVTQGCPEGRKAAHSVDAEEQRHQESYRARLIHGGCVGTSDPDDPFSRNGQGHANGHF
jgi:hypothetical protein